MEIKKTGLWFGRQAVRMCLMVLLVSILAFGLLTVSPVSYTHLTLPTRSAV